MWLDVIWSCPEVSNNIYVREGLKKIKNLFINPMGVGLKPPFLLTLNVVR